LGSDIIISFFGFLRFFPCWIVIHIMAQTKLVLNWWSYAPVDGESLRNLCVENSTIDVKDFDNS